MCLCQGTGRINTVRSWGVEFLPCPDSNCQFDKEAADRRYNEWRNRLDKFCKQAV